jgi:hypothetical protein
LFALTEPDENELRAKISLIEEAVNSSDLDAFEQLLSSNASADISEKLANDLANSSITYYQTISSIDELSDTKVRIKGSFSAQGAGGNGSWEINGMSNYFEFEKTDSGWLLVQTNMPDKLNSNFILQLVGKFALIIAIVAMVLGGFTLWMFIDAAVRPIDDKAVWIIVILILGVFGALIYFLFIRRRHLQQRR